MSLNVGTDTYIGLPDGSIGRFNAVETAFLTALSKTEIPNWSLAAESIGKDDEWAKRFFRSPKWLKLSSSRLAEAAAKSGLTQDRYFALLNATIVGFFVDWRGKCDVCLNSYTLFTEPEAQNSLYQLDCGICGSKLQLFENRREFKPTREQMEAIKELGNRVAPKIERVHHEYAKETFSFVEGEAS